MTRYDTADGELVNPKILIERNDPDYNPSVNFYLRRFSVVDPESLD